MISIFVWQYFKSISYAAASFLGGIVIDLDHFFDYYSNHPFTFRAKNIYITLAKRDLKKIYLILHSYELVILLWISINLLSLPKVWLAIAIGITQHIIFDQMTNPLNGFGYFLTYRIMKRFDRKFILREARS